MLWGDNFALGRQFCSEEAILLWGSKVAISVCSVVCFFCVFRSLLQKKTIAIFY
ncbi:MAG: hypothetical protein KBC30_05550 [Planctomycetes bacterium]|nr:hypothetical protein [Planctomycetota bacterium]